MEASRVFVGCRSLGEVSGRVPLVARYVKTRRETLLATAVDRCVYTYAADHLSLLAVSGAHPEPVSCLAGDAYHVYSAAGDRAYAWRRGAELQREYGPHGAPVRLLLPFATVLIVVDERSELSVWRIREAELYLRVRLDELDATAIVHPATYLNKVLLGGERGALQLWNVKTAKLVHSFAGWGKPVAALEQTPAVDVVAVGLADGRVVLHDIRADAKVAQFHQDWGRVSCISFRTDGGPFMVTGSSAGHLTVWDLEEKRVAHQITKAHERGVSGAICFPSEPILATNSSDNSLKIWIFDMPDGGARLLRIREGHSATPYFVRHVSNDGKILSAGADSRLRLLSAAAGYHSESLGRASFDKKASKKKKKSSQKNLMPPVISFSFSMQRDKEWDSVAALHRGLNMVTTWSLDKKRVGSHKIVPEGMSRDITCTCLVVSHCGNFVFTGYSNGEVYKFNMQSGLMRGRWGGPKGAHVGPVRGIETDNLNQRLFTAGIDNRFKAWHFNEAKVPIKAIRLEESVSFSRCHRESGLIALCNEDFTIILIDMDSMNVVRKFDGHSSKINDACFSHDSRWFLSAGMDRTIRVWDIPTGLLIDIFKVETPCTSLSMSLKGDFAITTHIGKLGAYLWGNRTLYAHVNLRPLDRNNLHIPEIELPTLASDAPKETLEDFKALNLDDELEFKSPEQISEELITLSSLPLSRWHNLLNLDVIKERNRPKAPPKTPKAAPFFLPTVPNLDLRFDMTDIARSDSTSKVISPRSFENLTPFGKSLKEGGVKGEYGECVQRIKQFGPSMVDYEINNFSLENGGSIDVLLQFMKMIGSMLESNKDFELAQSYLSLFLKVHGQVVVETERLREELTQLEASQNKGWDRLQEMLFYSLCTVRSIKNM